MRMACEDWDLGYDQYNRLDIRDGGECDCSSLVIWALERAGFDTGDASYTGNMSSNLTSRGWIRLPFQISQCKPGDILLNDTYHVCAVISGYGEDAIIAQASIDERGRATGGQSGDQSGRETNTRKVYIYSHGWDCILRYNGGSDIQSDLLDVDGVIGVKTVTKWQKAVGTYVDGEISGQYAPFKDHFQALTSVTWDSEGSALIRRVQSIIGVPGPTGVGGPHTVALLQAWLVGNGYSCGDDRVSYLDEGTAKALQKSLNDGKWS
jgi:hypothetical protein